VGKNLEMATEFIIGSGSDPSSHLPTTYPLPLNNHLDFSRESDPTPSSSQPEVIETTIVPRFREPEEDATDLNLVLDSLLPIIRDNK